MNNDRIHFIKGKIMRNFSFERINEIEYQEYRNKCDYKDILNSLPVLKTKEYNGWKVDFFGVKEEGKLIAVTPLCSRQTKKIFNIFYAQRGYLFNPEDAELLDYFTKNIIEYCKKNKGLYFVVDPAILLVERDINGEIVEGGFDNRYLIEAYEKCGFTYRGSPRDYSLMAMINWQFVLDLENKNEEELLKSFDQQTRWSINKTIKSGIKVRELEESEYNIFLDMEKRTAKRRGFEARSDDFFLNMKKENGENMKVYLAYLDVEEYKNIIKKEKEELGKDLKEVEAKLIETPNNKKLISKKKTILEAIDVNNNRNNDAEELANKYGNIINMSTSAYIITDDEIVYMYSATDDEFKKYLAQYAIQWDIIKKALALGIKKYNFYGISGNFNEDASDYGIYQFKRGFTGVVEQYLGEFIIPLNKIYSLYKKIK